MKAAPADDGLATGPFTRQRFGTAGKNCSAQAWLWGSAVRFVPIILAALIAGCATPYQDMGFSGGVEAQQMTANTFRIVARGNGYTASTTIQDYAILKAAETTRRAGGTHFAIISASDASSAGHITVPGQAHTSIVGNTAYTTYTPATAHRFIRPGQDVYIRILTIGPGQRPPPGVFSADEIIQFVGSRVKRPAA